MIRPSLLRAAAGVAIVGLFALAGCSDDKKSGADGAATEEGPLSKMFTAAWGDFDQAHFDKQQVEIENLVAECMAAEGFEYVPQDTSSMTVTVSEEDFADRNTAEWVAKNGYGMTMGMGSESEDPDEEDASPGWIDPNSDYVASLSEGEQTAYYEALSGVQNMEMTEEDMDEYVYNWEEGGCYGSAQHEVSGDEQDLYSDPKFEDLNESISELYMSVQTDPRVTEASAKWADCMADAGYDEFTSPDDAMTSLNEAQNELYSWEGEVDEEYTGPSDAAIAEFRELEIATAVADFACKQEADLDKISQKVQFELEEAFVKDHKAAIDEYIAAIQESRK